MATTRRHDVKDLGLAKEGVRRIDWADRNMPVLAAIRERFEREQPLVKSVAGSDRRFVAHEQIEEGKIGQIFAGHGETDG